MELIYAAAAVSACLLFLMIFILVKLAKLERGTEGTIGEALENKSEAIESLRGQLADFRVEFARTLAESQSEVRNELTRSLLEGHADLRKQLDDSLAENLHRSASRMDGLSERLDTRLNQTVQAVDRRLGEGAKISQESVRQTNSRLDGAAQAILKVERQLSELGESNRRLQDFGQNLQELQDILGAPKLRGVLGEWILADLLAQSLPASNYELQYKFKSTETVDAIVRMENGILPIDAKFPLENFRRLLKAPDEEQKRLRKAFAKDVKNRIDEIAKKYIKPDEGTMDFALMYIPAENVYYETIIRPSEDCENLSTYATSRRVVPVSPNSFYSYLRLIMMGLRGMRVEKHAREILAMLASLQGDFQKIRESFDLIGTHLIHAAKVHDKTGSKLDRFEDKLAAHRQLSNEKDKD